MSISARIERVRAEDLIDDPAPTRRRPVARLSVRRRLLGLAVTAVALAGLTAALTAARSTFSLESVVLLYLLVVVGAAVGAGVAVALLAAGAAAVLINFFFVEPLHTFDVADGDQVLSLAIFVAVAGVVSAAVEVATRRARAAEAAVAAAETMSALAGPDLDHAETLHDILSRARQTFGMESVALKDRHRRTDEWLTVEQAGWAPEGQEAPLRFDLPITPWLRLLGRGPELFAEDRQVLDAFAGAAQTAYEGRRLSEQARSASELAGVDRQRTALLAAVGHDLRTPLAAVKAAVSSLRQTDVEWTDAERDGLLATIEASADQLDALVANLLDASRLQAGAVVAAPSPVALDEVIGAVVLELPGGSEHVRLDVPEDLPLVAADRGLLERVLANLIDNALRHAADSGPVEIAATAGADSAKLAIVDHGPGVPAEERERIFAAFQRPGDRSPGGVGLGLSVARGFTEAMGGALTAEQSYGGGLTMRLRLPLAGAAR
jgi:K+-sensing histidine kinase KdpD